MSQSMEKKIRSLKNNYLRDIGTEPTDLELADWIQTTLKERVKRSTWWSYRSAFNAYSNDVDAKRILRSPMGVISNRDLIKELQSKSSSTSLLNEFIEFILQDKDNPLAHRSAFMLKICLNTGARFNEVKNIEPVSDDLKYVSISNDKTPIQLTNLFDSLEEEQQITDFSKRVVPVHDHNAISNLVKFLEVIREMYNLQNGENVIYFQVSSFIRRASYRFFEFKKINNTTPLNLKSARYAYALNQLRRLEKKQLSQTEILILVNTLLGRCPLTLSHAKLLKKNKDYLHECLPNLGQLKSILSLFLSVSLSRN